jgi:uncharacterized membrane protein
MVEAPSWTPEGSQRSHGAARASFTALVDQAPQHVVRVELCSAATGEAIANAEVNVGRYRSSSEADGTSSVRVPPGTYELTIRCDGYEADAISLDVKGDVSASIRARAVLTRQQHDSDSVMGLWDYPWT